MVWSCAAKTNDCAMPLRSEMMQVEGSDRTRGRSILTWVEVVQRKMMACDLMADMALARVEWRKMSRVANPK